ncbi:MAG: restriction endonuclease subunit S [Methanosarcina sp.]|uniref:restriction endonuclease subunit S n=1 Tax=Methanosarcina sp. TaxID=2213 RepID=UPI0026396869|nr:restriction endonuclease subunit S [Methanosarcina sp.]MDD3245774.1 restriction endonuclease subunit S [Methanosarcina sp.]MDD4249425.1 restriction endonuclease subunit S [Methanosarcina sp.]
MPKLFLYHLVLNTKEYVQSHSTQSMKGMISKSSFTPILFIMPPIEAQKKFVEFAKRVERITISQQQSSLEIKNLFDFLMQKAFTGELVS